MTIRKTETAYVLYDRTLGLYYCRFEDTPCIHKAEMFDTCHSAALYKADGFEGFEVVMLYITFEIEL